MGPIYIFLGAAIGFVAGILFVTLQLSRRKENAQLQAQRILEEATRQAENIKKEAFLEAREEILREKQSLEEEIQKKRKELQNLENRLLRREEVLERRMEQLERSEAALRKAQEALEREKREVELMKAQEIQELSRIAGLSIEEAQRELLERVEKTLEYEISLRVKEAEERARKEAERVARDIVGQAIQRYAADFTVESTVSVVTLPNDEMKGRIIGREGRNIRTFEMMTGVDLIIDDTPEAVIISCFDPIRREVARIALEKLIMDGRIHPARIEELIEKAKIQVEEKILQEGEQALFDTGIKNVHPELVKLLGKLYFRTSYGQNVLQHAKEVAHFASLMASELGANVHIAKRAGLLHDIGKALDHEVEGPHARIGAELLGRYGEKWEVIHAVEAHHGDVDPQTLEAVLVQAADAISASRPGARRESLEAYIKRLERLEKIADSFEGVEKAYAIQAGREVRIIVKPDRVDDAGAAKLAWDIAKRIEKELEYPGQIKVTVIRETRAIEYAK
ncbi:MAG: ribonuclease Y [Candidatus Caldatribacterium sp.]|uniref:ribonuclease Y n=1 Tax=Candidatus Caldatribacterium sp. TaxID=2282143 RepID=UPI002996E971|nr:ribonuclease Y [Candidatus Caldatribacterium sp.]MCX7731113.1 ribonuclease Y [Candidatus Caldatribacterium sp.]MDW8081454.1 ribonuclease Y [Candidatus Calescibacterium sp.]